MSTTNNHRQLEPQTLALPLEIIYTIVKGFSPSSPLNTATLNSIAMTCRTLAHYRRQLLFKSINLNLSVKYLERPRYLGFTNFFAPMLHFAEIMGTLRQPPITGYVESILASDDSTTLGVSPASCSRFRQQWFDKARVAWCDLLTQDYPNLKSFTWFSSQLSWPGLSPDVQVAFVRFLQYERLEEICMWMQGVPLATYGYCGHGLKHLKFVNGAPSSIAISPYLLSLHPPTRRRPAPKYLQFESCKVPDDTFSSLAEANRAPIDCSNLRGLDLSLLGEISVACSRFVVSLSSSLVCLHILTLNWKDSASLSLVNLHALELLSVRTNTHDLEGAVRWLSLCSPPCAGSHLANDRTSLEVMLSLVLLPGPALQLDWWGLVLQFPNLKTTRLLGFTEDENGSLTPLGGSKDTRPWPCRCNR